MKKGTEFWMAHVAAVKLEAISASAYARRHGISVAALYYWQHKLKSKAEVGEGQKSKFLALHIVIIYSLVETAKANGVEPYTWLRHVLQHLPAAQTADEMEKLLLWNFHAATLTNIMPR